MAPSQIADYTILPLTLPPQRSLQLPNPATHTLYLRPHAPKVPTESDSRSLFLVNVPADATSAHLRAVFASLLGAGRFESVSFEGEKMAGVALAASVVAGDTDKRSGGKKRKRGIETTDNREVEVLPRTWDRELHRSGSTAVVVLVDEKSVESTLKTIRKLHKSSRKDGLQWPVWGEGVETKVATLGSARYAAHHALRYPDPVALQSNVDAFMTSFNDREAETARQAKKARNIPDEDGFVTVTRGGRTGPARREDAENKRREMEEKEREKRESMGNFYRFQMRERRKAEQGELVKRFEEDRKRVESMREKRGRFRPET
jgi:ribosomal RNA-processing protein 7